ncbi:hypothetical protein [Rubinisphaera italica]|uniref:Uncharacterized protein n=1 Tax=Rubinisphaera italica TaxID=2527969 RepID=A0A5C5XM57_9PLAN|nr:hypothetical protein [Rubinisphaera italica]TWT64237.1 hypothetical protein Pan54_49980 [Rubinisphaera italica]
MAGYSDSWIQTGMLCSLIANLAHKDNKKVPADFMPITKIVNDQNQDQQKAVMDRAFKLLAK